MSGEPLTCPACDTPYPLDLPVTLVTARVDGGPFAHVGLVVATCPMCGHVGEVSVRRRESAN